MTILDKREAEEILGKFGLLKRPAALVNETKYLGGVSAIDMAVGDSLIKNPMLCWTRMPNGLELGFSQGLKFNRLAFLYDGINYWTMEKLEVIKESKKKSVLGRAVIGGLLLGPVGAVVGGMSGIGDKEVKVSELDNILTLSYLENNQETILLMSVKNKYEKSVKQWLHKNLPEKFSAFEEIQDS